MFARYLLLLFFHDIDELKVGASVITSDPLNGQKFEFAVIAFMSPFLYLFYQAMSVLGVFKA